MSERSNNDITRSEGRDPTQGQGQGQYNVDPSTRDPRFSGPDIHSEGRGSAQGQGQLDTDTHHPHPDNRANDSRQERDQSADTNFTRHDPARGQPDQHTRPFDIGKGLGHPQQGQQYQGKDQSADPDFVRHDPARGQPDQHTRLSDTSNGLGHLQQGQGQLNGDNHHPHIGNRADDPHREKDQLADPNFARHDPARGQPDRHARPLDTGKEPGHPQQGQQGQWRQGGQIASDNIPGGYVEPHQAEYKAGCYHQGGTTGTGPGAGPGRQDIPSDGGFGGKVTLPERVMGATEKMVGKATGNVRMYQHGQERQEGGY